MPDFIPKHRCSVNLGKSEWHEICVQWGCLVKKKSYGLKAIVFFTLKVEELFIIVQNNIQVKLSVNCISLEDYEILLQGSKNQLDEFLSGVVFVFTLPLGKVVH